MSDPINRSIERLHKRLFICVIALGVNMPLLGFLLHWLTNPDSVLVQSLSEDYLIPGIGISVAAWFLLGFFVVSIRRQKAELEMQAEIQRRADFCETEAHQARAEVVHYPATNSAIYPFLLPC